MFAGWYETRQVDRITQQKKMANRKSKRDSGLLIQIKQQEFQYQQCNSVTVSLGWTVFFSLLKSLSRDLVVTSWGELTAACQPYVQ